MYRIVLKLLCWIGTLDNCLAIFDYMSRKISSWTFSGSTKVITFCHFSRFEYFLGIFSLSFAKSSSRCWRFLAVEHFSNGAIEILWFEVDDVLIREGSFDSLFLFRNFAGVNHFIIMRLFYYLQILNQKQRRGFKRMIRDHSKSFHLQLALILS